jgi:hypothetical protein
VDRRPCRTRAPRPIPFSGEAESVRVTKASQIKTDVDRRAINQ